MKTIKTITKGYINFSEDVENNTFSVIKKGFSKTIRWAAEITNYESAKIFKRNYFDFEDLEIEVKKLRVGYIIELRDQTKISSKYSNQYSSFILIYTIGMEEIELESFETVSKAYRAKQNWVNSPNELK